MAADEPLDAAGALAAAAADPIYAEAGRRIATRPLRLGIFDDFIRGTAGCESLIGAATPLPAMVGYRDWCDDPARVDAVMATVRDAGLLAGCRVPTVLFLQEPRLLYPYPPLPVLRTFDLVLTHDADVLAALPSARWCSLIGTQLDATRQPPPKRELVSLLDSGKRLTEGHRIRGELAQHPTLAGHVYGAAAGRFVEDKWAALGAYYFHVAVENVRGFNTEKIIDALLAACVPIYYGDTTMLAALGFDVTGIMAFGDKRHAEVLLTSLPTACMDWYESRRDAVAANRVRALQLTTPEVLVDALVRREFGIPYD